MTIALFVLAVVLIILGIAGTIVPALPGVLLVFLGLVVAAWAEGFQYVGTGILLILGVLTAISYVLDFVATAFGVKRTGASPRAFWGAALGSIVGIFFGLIGLILGPFIGAVVGELSAKKGLRDATVAGYGAWIGLVIGTALKLTLTFLMVGIFLLARVFNDAPELPDAIEDAVEEPIAPSVSSPFTR